MKLLELNFMNQENPTALPIGLVEMGAHAHANEDECVNAVTVE
jgi:hypothetical protein